ncbi:hypothetical protein SAMN05421805_107184 [Saccharopolyspora antimicrobica]|uniref:Uncharacterized protein n=1 Tax=Saccharopolyspora antimicrobica TaxID=455193 RepID=A0A1I5CHL7_9PSEU|nr:hypothetical protein [Saccharopolyspora antimicrobica]RKT88853.1 hypothetical protein ATL45_7296 [Saccharopolyspora antimicrobica]SFN86416.1 hypothetical protein SAMN05421805_107184 [Saccharopolyspora antimicrobica]
MSTHATEAAGPAVSAPRDRVVAAAWAELGPGVAALSNASGRPLARTVKLILDPLVLRPAQNPHLGGGRIDQADTAELRQRILDAAADLTATAAWFAALKRARRAARITGGNPQDLYFQRCFELARTHGAPGADAGQVALEVVQEIRDATGDMTVAQLRRHMTDQVDALTALLEAAWREVPNPEPGEPASVEDFLDSCGQGDADGDAFDRLLETAAGTRASAGLGVRGAARDHGLTDLPLPEPPRLGDNASKNRLPKPFDRSIFERLFAAFTSSFHRESMDSVPGLVRAEITRSALPWQLGEERSRLTVLLGREASGGLTGGPQPTAAHRRLGSRWEREAYVRRVLRLPGAASGVPEDLRSDVVTVRQAYLRRLWVRVHGRELRGERLEPHEVWDLLDGVLRSVIMDHRQRLKQSLTRETAGAA